MFAKDGIEPETLFNFLASKPHLYRAQHNITAASACVTRNDISGIRAETLSRLGGGREKKQTQFPLKGP